MFKNVLGKAAVLACSAMVAVTCLGAVTAKADTADNGTLKVTYKYSSQKQRNSGRRNMFNAASSEQSSQFAIISMQEGNSNSYTASYCMDYNKIAGNRDRVTAGYNDISAEEKTLLNYTLLNGFSKDYTNPESISTEDANLYYATQCLVWVITEGAFNDDAKRTQLENLFGANNADIKASYEKLYKDVQDAVTLPDFAAADAKNAKTTTLSWDASANAYVAVIKNIGNLKNATIGSLPEGVTVDIKDDQMTIKSTKELSNQSLKFTIKSSAKGSLVCWGNGAGRQPQATIDNDAKATDFDVHVNVNTDKKADSVVTPIAPANDNKEIKDETAPKADTPEQKKTEDVVTPIPTEAAPAAGQAVAPAAENGTALEPKTSDSTPVIAIAIVAGLALIGASIYGIRAFKLKKN